MEADPLSILENGTIRLGINLNLGGAITELRPIHGENLINSYDWGRQVQMSYYSGPVPFEPHGKRPLPYWAALGWNPIQSGDAYGNRARILAHYNDGRQIYVRSIPMQWPLDDEPGECFFECWFRLDGPVVQVQSRLRNLRSDRTQYQGRDQELPAVYTNGPYHRLFSYTGDAPFTHQPPTEQPAVFPWTSWLATENWAALVNDRGFGLGVLHPGCFRFLGGFAGSPGVGGPTDFPTGYIAPLHQEILDHNIHHEYRYSLVVGSLGDIQSAAYRGRRPRAVVAPAWTFSGDRRHWHYVNAADTGWPIRNELDIRSFADDPQLLSPEFAAPAAAGRKLLIEAAYRADAADEAQVFWARLDAPEFAEARSLKFRWVPDGTFRTYEIDLGASAEYHGVVTRLRIDPLYRGRPGASLRIRRVVLVPR